jgi:hypothetical protein
MERRYYSQLGYFFKAIFIIILVGLFFYVITVASHELAAALSMEFRKNLVAIEYVINISVGIICLLTILLIILRGKPNVIITETSIKTNRFKKNFDELKSYHPGKGGSEPFVISKDGKQYDIELSWFSKRDRQEIEAFIKDRVATA